MVNTGVFFIKIAIIGCRGIPNAYGGFEQFAEIVSKVWVEMGHQVICYSPRQHDYQGAQLNGVEIRHIWCPEQELGPLSHYIYDYLSLRDAVKTDCDIYLQLGYQSSAPSYFLFGKSVRSKIITNMDGMEWKRSKWSWPVKLVTKLAEKIAVSLSGAIVSDNQGIADYFSRRYGVRSDVIAYGCDPIGAVTSQPKLPWLSDGLCYDLVIARLEPENNVEMIIKGFIAGRSGRKLVIIGSLDTEFAKYLVSEYAENEFLLFVGGIYDELQLQFLRQNSTFYYHGHSVGGTNPSLIEAMAAGAFVIAHDNEFNRSVLGTDNYYFKCDENIRDIIVGNKLSDLEISEIKKSSIKNIEENFQWSDIATSYIETFKRVLDR